MNIKKKLNKKTAALYLSLCFFPKYKIKFIPTNKQKKLFFGDIWFNGDIQISISDDINIINFNWKPLIKIITKQLKNRNILKTKFKDSIYNMTVRTFLNNNFFDNLIDAKLEMQEEGNSRIAAMYNTFLDSDDELYIDFFKELKKLYKHQINMYL